MCHTVTLKQLPSLRGNPLFALENNATVSVLLPRLHCLQHICKFKPQFFWHLSSHVSKSSLRSCKTGCFCLNIKTAGSQAPASCRGTLQSFGMFFKTFLFVTGLSVHSLDKKANNLCTFKTHSSKICCFDWPKKMKEDV